MYIAVGGGNQSRDSRLSLTRPDSPKSVRELRDATLPRSLPFEAPYAHARLHRGCMQLAPVGKKPHYSAGYSRYGKSISIEEYGTRRRYAKRDSAVT